MDSLFRSKRALKCVIDGRVISLAELQGSFSWRSSTAGFAVLPPLITEYLPERLKPQSIRVYSPADGVVISLLGGVTLRTGDGVIITVITGLEAEYRPTVGTKVMGGELLCEFPREQLLNNGMNGAVAVMFPDAAAITELHVLSGRRRAGFRTAFYRIQPPEQH